MSGSGGFLGRALASRESAYFLQQSKHAVGNLIANKPKTHPSSSSSAKSNNNSSGDGADVLPEVLRHSLPLVPPSYYTSSSPSPSSFSTASKWALSSDSSSRRASDAVINPLRDYVSLPQATLGPRRWSLPESQVSVMASTANELRPRGDTYVNPEKLKAAAEGLAHVGKAFAIATFFVFGGAAFAFSLAASKLQVQTTDDIKVKGQDIFQPKIEAFREKMVPLRDQAEVISRKWHIEGEGEIKERPVIKELSKMLGSGMRK